MIKAIFFDMDGVLIDAKEWHYEALNRALGLFGMAIEKEAHVSTYDGLPTKTKLAMLSETEGLPEGLHDFLNELKQNYTTELIYSSCRPQFQHRYALARLKKEGYNLAVCSNSIRKTVHLMMSRARLIEYFDLMLSNEDVTKAKPAPEVYETAINHFNLKPHEVVILEDNEYGIQAARQSGAHVMEISDPKDVHYENIKNFIFKTALDSP